RVLADHERRHVVLDHPDQRLGRAVVAPRLAHADLAAVGLDEGEEHRLGPPPGAGVPYAAAHLAPDQPGRDPPDPHPPSPPLGSLAAHSATPTGVAQAGPRARP